MGGVTARDEAEVRRRILARRALFVAAALAGCRSAEKLGGAGAGDAAAHADTASSVTASDAAEPAASDAIPGAASSRRKVRLSPMPGVCLSIRPPSDDEAASGLMKAIDGDAGVDAPKAAPSAKAPASASPSAGPKPRP
jgi:hypothetical protein